MMLLEYGDDIIVVDVGLMFPEEEMLGVDLVIPDFTYLREHAHKLRGVFLTHGHEDHVGALPYFFREFKCPVYSSKLTDGLIRVKLNEHRQLAQAELHVVKPGESVQAGVFEVEFFTVAHSIPDACGLIIKTPLGPIVHTGDFKLDHTPVMDQHTDLIRLAQIGAEGCLLLCADSTYAEQEGYTPSEQLVGEALRNILVNAKGRVIVATFASLISRVQQVVDAAVFTNRKVFVTGRSMIDNRRARTHAWRTATTAISPSRRATRSSCRRPPSRGTNRRCTGTWTTSSGWARRCSTTASRTSTCGATQAARS
jgi:ribonuclease J